MCLYETVHFGKVHLFFFKASLQQPVLCLHLFFLIATKLKLCMHSVIMATFIFLG